MWRNLALLGVGLLACAAVLSCGGGAKPCPQDLASSRMLSGPQAARLSLKDAQDRVGFKIKVPAHIPTGIRLDHVEVQPSSRCSNDERPVDLVFTGAGNGFIITEIRGGLKFSDSGEPLRINGTNGQVQRRTESHGQVLTIAWNAGGLGFIATALLGEPISSEDFLQIAQSMPD